MNKEGKMYRLVYNYAWMEFSDQKILVVMQVERHILQTFNSINIFGRIAIRVYVLLGWKNSTIIVICLVIKQFIDYHFFEFDGLFEAIYNRLFRRY